MIADKYSKDKHLDSEKIGYRNWQAYEIDAEWVYLFSLKDILIALKELIKWRLSFKNNI